MREPWWKTAVIYQVYPRSFQDSDGDGVGDLEGIRQRIPYLADMLGVDAIWISPFYPSPQADFGYDVADYTDVDPTYGTLDGFQRLLDGCHAAGLRVIIDWVPNHSSDQHPWFVESRSSRHSTKRDWYVWSDPTSDGGPPNNWLSVFGGSAWEFDESSGQYYLHSFLREQPDINWRNPEVKAAMLDTLRFWLDRGVDGFRIDVPLFMMKDPLMRSNPLRTGPGIYHKDLGAFDSQEHVYDMGHRDIHGLFEEIGAVVAEYPGDRFTIAEIHEFDWKRWAHYYGEGRGLSMPFNFALLKAGDAAQGVAEVVKAVEAVTPAGGWPNYVWGNHDEARVATRLGDDGARRAAVLLLTLRGTPTMYYGDEVGMLEAEVPPDRQQDPWGKRVPGLSRDGCRTPMQWDDSTGFSAAATTWLPQGPDRGRRNVEAQLDEPGSMLELYRRLLTVRRESPALQLGELDMLSTPTDVFAFRRRHEDREVRVVVNYSSAPHALDVSGVALVSTVREPGTRIEKVLGGEAVVVG